MRDQQAWHAAKRRHRQALSAGDDDVLAELQRAAGHADHDQRFEHAVIRTVRLVAEDHRDPEDELDLLLEGVEGLARDGPDRQRGAQGGHDRRRSTQRPGRSDAAPRGTNQRPRNFMVRVERVGRSQVVDPGADRGFAAFHRTVECAKKGAYLGRKLFEVHGGEAYMSVLGANESQGSGADSNTYLRPCRDKA